MENFAFNATKARSYAAGSQDHCGLLFPGINKLCYGAPSSNWPHAAVTLSDRNDPAQARVADLDGREQRPSVAPHASLGGWLALLRPNRLRLQCATPGRG